MSIERCSRAFRFFIAIDIIGFRHLLHQKTMAVAIRHFMLAERAGDIILVEMKKKRLERHRIELQHERRNTNERKNPRRKRSIHVKQIF